MKYQHENPNIEIINENLWAVRFSLLPFIPQISWKSDPTIPDNKIPFQLSPSGVIVLNKDFSLYPLFQVGFPNVMKLWTGQLKRELEQLLAIPDKQENLTNPQVIRLFCLQAEFDRRKVV